MGKISVFTPSVIKKLEEAPVASRITQDALKDDYPSDDAEKSWLFDPVGTGFKSTQQLNIDWSDFSKHTFFHSAEAKVNSAYEKIINYFPFDGSAKEIQEFKDSMNGWENYVYSLFPKYKGFLNFQKTNYITISDMEGYLYPTLARKSTLKNVIGTGLVNSGYTLECFFLPPDDSTNNDTQAIFQKLDISGYNGITLAVSKSLSTDTSVEIHSIISSGSSSEYYKLHISASIDKGTFSHIATIYDKNKSDCLYLLVNGTPVASSSGILEFSSLPFMTESIVIGSGSYHFQSDEGFQPQQLLTASVDELRFWTYPKLFSEVSSSVNKSVSDNSGLGLYLKFNEPTGSYDNYNLVLDSSGNGLHGTITNYTVEQRIKESDVAFPIKYENIDNHPVLFPDYPTLATENIRLLNSASNYDSYNPNHIINLVPRHYLEQDLIQPVNTHLLPEYTSSIAFPGGGKMPSNQIIASFLYMWSAFFDDLKLYVDAFGDQANLNYEDIDGLPIVAIQRVAREHGYDLPNIFSEANPAQFHMGRDLTEDLAYSSITLKKILYSIWRRVTTEIPHIQRAKGTISSIRMMLNSFGINPDSNFRIREYGGKPELKITNLRKEKRLSMNMINFTTQSMFMSSSHLLAYRWAQGLPLDEDNNKRLPKLSFAMNALDARWFYGIPTTVTYYPRMRTLTSASWAVEGHYILDQDTIYATQSLLRLDVSQSAGAPDSAAGIAAPVMNILAYSGSGNSLNEYGLRLILAGNEPEDTPLVDLSLDNVNMFDGGKWYVGVNNHYEVHRAKLELIAINAVGDRIYQEHVTSSYYPLTASHPLRKYLSTDSPSGEWDGSFLSPDFDHQPTSPGSASLPFLSIGYNSAYDTEYLNNSSNATTSGQTDFYGKVGGIRLWSDALKQNEYREHALNPFSVGRNEPFAMSAYSHDDYTAIGKQGSTVFTSYKTDEILQLPSGSWGRLRMQVDMIGPVTASDSVGNLSIPDLSLNEYNLSLRGAPTSSVVVGGEAINYSIFDSNWDSPSLTNKVRVRSYQDPVLAKLEDVTHGKLTELDPREVIADDKRFAMDVSVSQALNDDMVNILSELMFINSAVGAPENMFAVNYPTLDRIADKYFNRLSDKVVFKHFFEFFKWFDSNFSSMIEQLVPRTTEFMGVNFVIESHMLERHKLQYQQADVHIDLSDRLAARIDPLLQGTVRREIT